MCGIAGIFNFSSSSIDISSKITAMTKALAHRGPDGEGFYFDGNITALGHRRLAIIDCSQAAHQPMQYEHLYLIFNGEIYNYVEIRAQLLNIGYAFVSNSDAEVLLKAYHHWGEDCLSHFEGMFAFAIWNSTSKRLFIARDRFGEKPLFYTVQNGIFYFASEIKAFFATGIIPEINKNYFCQFLSGVKSKKIAQLTDTYFENIYQLAPASYIYLDANCDHKIVAHKYWDINISTEKIQFENAENKLRDHLMKSISMRLRSDVPLGNSLSGGLDSSTIVMLQNKITDENAVHLTFSAIFPDQSEDESIYIEELLKNTKDIHALTCAPDAISFYHEFKAFVNKHDQPVHSPSVYAQYKVMQLVQTTDVKVLIDGQGADEILAGYDAYFAYRFLSNDVSIREILKYDKFGWAQKFAIISKKYHLPIGKLKKIFPKSALQQNILYNIDADDADFFKFNSLKDKLKSSAVSGDLQLLLSYADTNSMAFSKEIRLPFLSKDVVEFCFSLPEEFLINRNWTKFLLRKAMQNTLPEKITWRKDKIGFTASSLDWHKHHLWQNTLQISLHRLCELGYLDQKILNQSSALKADEIWRIILGCAWIERFS